MPSRPAVDVARRCLCLELLHQRYALETDTEDPISDREKARTMWLSRDRDLGIADALLPSERSFLERSVGELAEDDLDDLHGRATGAVVFLWALGRLQSRPTFAIVDEMETVLADHGLLGDGSIAKANAAVNDARLRDEAELDAALGTYLKARGKAREVVDPEKIVAALAAHHLTWILDDEMAFDEDIALD